MHQHNTPADEFVIDQAAVKELQLIEASLSDVDTEITAKQYLMAKDILAARQNTIARIPGFWAVVFDHASSELEAAITGADLSVFAKALKAIEIDRPEMPASAHPSQVGLAHFGEPRSVTIRFHWAPDNEWFADPVLEKTFFYRHGKDGSAGLVSDPVRINWKPGHDLTEGLTDAAYAFWDAQRRDPSQQLDGVLAGDARKARDAAARALPEYKALTARIEEVKEDAISFFNFFSYRGRWTSAAESAEAKAELLAKRQAAADGGHDHDEDEDEDEDFPEEDVETFPAGHECAVAIAEDIFPSAIDYFMADTIDSDDELDGLDIDNTDDEDEADIDVEMS